MRATLLSASALAIATVVVAIAGVTGCHGSHEQAMTLAPDAAAPMAPRSTTSGHVAVGNLDAEITGLERALEQRPKSAELRARLVDRYLMRIQFTGRFVDFERGAALLPDTAVSAPDYALQGRLDASLHRFESALASLARAEDIDGDPRERAREGIALALGHELPQVLGARLERAERAPSFASLSDVAAAQAALGQYEQADASFERALLHYRDASPFSVAWIAFQRGVMWSEMAAEPERGRVFYEEAVARLPEYVAAQVHLSELEFAAGATRAAVERLEAIAEQTEDPEPHARLAQFLQLDAPAAARAHVAEANRRYLALLERHREAFLDHAAEFFLNAGDDPQLALELARENLALRQTDRAYLLGIRAARVAGALHIACALSSEAGVARPTVALRHAQQELAGACSGKD